MKVKKVQAQHGWVRGVIMINGGLNVFFEESFLSVSVLLEYFLFI
jgi:hypothetical protein